MKFLKIYFKVDVEVIDTPSCEPKKPNLSFSISNLLGNSDRDSKKSRKHIRSPTGSNNSSSGVSSGSGSSSETESGPTSGPLPVQSMQSMVKSFPNGHPAVMPHFAQFSQNLAAAHHPFRQFKSEVSFPISGSISGQINSKNSKILYFLVQKWSIFNQNRSTS